MPSASTVAITGATGFIGGAITLTLTALGYRVRALARATSDVTTLDESVEIVRGSLDDAGSVAELLEQAESLILCAGRVRGSHREQFVQTNCDGVRFLLEAAQRCSSLERVVLMSSLAAREPQLSPYAKSKHAGELALERVAPRLACVALRPPAVYGPGDREMLPLFKLMARGLCLRWGDPDSRISLIHVEDLVAAVVALLRSDTPLRGTFELHDGHEDGYSLDEIRQIAESVCARRIRSLSIPPAVLNAAAWGNFALAKAFTYDPMLTPWKLQELRHPRWVCDNKRVTSALNWAPRITLAQGLETVLSVGENSH